LNEKTYLYRHSICLDGRACRSLSPETGSTTYLQGRKVLWNCQSRKKRLRVNRKQLLRRNIQDK